MRVAEAIKLNEENEREFRALVKQRRIEARFVQRARIVLFAAEGRQNKDIAAEVGLDRRQVALWRSRFLQGGIDALRQDAARSGRTPTVTPEVQSRTLARNAARAAGQRHALECASRSTRTRSG